MQEATVGHVVKKIKILLEGEFRRVVVRGEISNLTKSYSGHWYFTLSDSSSSLSAALFRTDSLRNPIISKIKDGEEVICTGNIGVYAPRGTFQLVVNQLIKAGKGELLERFELLKQKLAAEGLFDASLKKMIPAHPQRIAVITAESGAALQDFIKIYRRLSCTGDIVVVPALVQGINSAKSLRQALHNVQHVLKGVDVIVIARGGGSLEDLWSFNDEKLARDIYSCEIPILSAVGHQTDFTICDFVADLRAETPSAAAELIAREQVTVQERLSKCVKIMCSTLDRVVSQKKETLSRYQPKSFLSVIFLKLQRFQKRLYKCDLSSRATSLVGIGEKAIRLDEDVNKIQELVKVKMVWYQHRLELAIQKLEALSPNEIFKRGYCLVENNMGKVISSYQEFVNHPKNDPIVLSFFDGKGRVKKDD